jgi:hypothetical protein
LIRYCFEGRPHDLMSASLPRQTDQSAAGIRVPVRGTKSSECRNKIDPSPILPCYRRAASVRGSSDNSKLVA